MPNPPAQPLPVASDGPSPDSETASTILAREAALRLSTIQTFRDLDDQLRRERRHSAELAQQLAAQLAETNYWKERHAEAARTVAQLHDDVRVFGDKLAIAEDESARLNAERRRLAKSWRFRLLGLRSGGRRPHEVVAPPSRLHESCRLQDSPFRMFRPGGHQVSGTIVGPQATRITAFRARLEGREIFGQLEPREAETAFSVQLNPTPGRHQLILEVQVEHGHWEALLETSIWSVA